MHTHLLPPVGFRHRPIVVLSTATADRLPLLACDAAHAVLRDVWLQSAMLNGWYVGQYLVRPDHVHLFAWPAADARPLPAWTRTWKVIAALRIGRTVQWSGPLWEAGYSDRYISSSEDYAREWEGMAAPLATGNVTEAPGGPFRGVIWDLHSHLH